MAHPTRLLTPGTTTHAVNHALTMLDTHDGAQLGVNSHGYCAFDSTLWVGYFTTARMCKLAVSMVRCVTRASEKEDG